ncbi:MAG TPA: hypothetical protein VHC21_04190 [Candidatus Saccharimonadales bacterium]|nr:hypothetical protein [Candidatus Saccharimonadales bacterium]
MNAVKTAVAAPEQNPDLLTDLLEAVKDQYEEDGTLLTPYDSDRERREVLTERWAGTIIAAKVLEDSPVRIVKQGDEGIYEDVGKYEKGKYFAPKPFPEMAGVIDSVSPAYGGYIALDRNWSVVLPNRDGKRLLQAPELGLSIEILATN